jgi:hypothetical protein
MYVQYFAVITNKIMILLDTNITDWLADKRSSTGGWFPPLYIYTYIKLDSYKQGFVGYWIARKKKKGLFIHVPHLAS